MRGKIFKAAKLLAEICGGWWGLMSSVPSIPLYFAGLYFFHGTEKVWFWTGAFVCLWILVIRMGWKNYRLMEATKSPSNPDLEIEPVPSDSAPAKRHPFHIRIQNKNPSRNADDLKVEVVSFTDALSEQFQSVAKRYFHPSHFDRVAELKSATGRSTINPRDGLEFTVFYFEPSMKIQGQPRSVVATFDLKDTKTKENAAHFYEDREYRIVFAASARGEGMSRVEREFKFYFSTVDGVCQVKANPVVVMTEAEKAGRRQKAKEAVAKLTEIGTLFANCISSLKGIDPNEYNAGKDDGPVNVNNAAIAYILFNLNQDASKEYDNGIAEITPWSVRKSGMGSTRYEDDYNIVLERLSRRFLNLKSIAEDIEKYLK